MRVIIGAALIAIAAPACASDYVVIQLHSDVRVDADAAWARVGAFCGIGAWGKVPCKLVSGDGGVGSVRALAGGVVEEPMVARTPRSYTYSQTVGDRKDMDYHGTLAIEPTGPKRARIDYTIVYDQARAPEDKRAGMREQIGVQFEGLLGSIKAMAEGK